MSERDERKQTDRRRIERKIDDIETGVASLPREQHGGNLPTGHVVSGVQAAWRVQLRAKHPVGESPTETKDSSFVAWEASWRESKATEPSDIWLEGAMQNTRLQHNVNVDVASLLSKIRWLSWSRHSESNKSRIETSPIRRLSPAGYQRRHGVKDGVSTGEALDVRQGNLAEEMTAITVSGKCRCRHQGVGSGHNVRQEVDANQRV